MRRWFRDLRVSRKLMVVIVVHLMHAAILLVVTAYGMKALSASRAYVEGEGLWSKAQKEATLELIAFAGDGNVTHYEAFLRDLDVTLGDRQAREELDKAHPDPAIVRDGFLRGKLHPDDIDDVVWLYENFGDEPHLARAIASWVAADTEIEVLRALAEDLREAILRNDTTAVAGLVAEVYASDARLTLLEDDFSRDLGDGVRWLTRVVNLAAIGLTIVFVGLALVISATAARQITRSLQRLNETAEAVSSGDLTRRVGLDGRDEVAAVGRTFDGMANRVAQLANEANQRNAELAESLSRFQALAQDSPMGIFRTDAAGVLEYANPRMAAMAGAASTEEAGLWGAIHRDDLASIQQQWKAAVAAGAAVQADFRFVHPGGAIVRALVRARPVLDSAGAVTGFVGTMEDITLQRQAEEARMKAQEQGHEIKRLEEINTFRTQFINTAAHELRTPLTPLRIQLNVLRHQRGDAITAEEKRSLDLVDRNVERLGVLVEDMLQVARYQVGRLGMEPAPADMHRVAREAAESFAEAAKARGVTLEFASRGDGSGSFDAKRMSQVTYNLLSNALKFTPSGGRILVESLGLPEGLGLDVVDTGIGIKPADLKKLFQPFSQVHAEPTGQPGSGLGLYICKAIVELHGGTIMAESAGIGHGTAVSVRLPRRR